MTHLRLVRPSVEKAPKKRHRTLPVFSPEEANRLRAALRHARALFSTWACLADAMHTHRERIKCAAAGKYPMSADIALRLARALGKPVESLYAAPTSADRCPHCGRGGAS